MQQDSATLIYDLNAMKGTMKSYLKKIEQAFKTEYFQAWKIAPSSVSLKKSENCFEPPWYIEISLLTAALSVVGDQLITSCNLPFSVVNCRAVFSNLQ